MLFAEKLWPSKVLETRQERKDLEKTDKELVHLLQQDKVEIIRLKESIQKGLLTESNFN